MITSVFGQDYANEYDILYGDKDYELECDLIEEAFRRYSEKPVYRIMDLGCGTGNHSIPLIQRGYRVTGVDISGEMLLHAKKKLEQIKDPSISGRLELVQGDARYVHLGMQFDAVLMMFAVFGYQKSNEDVAAVLQTIKRHINSNGLLIFDVWYGPAVLAIRPGDRVKKVSVDKGEIIRIASGSLDVARHLAKISYHVWHISNKQLISESQEIHEMRYFFPMELAYFLQQAGFELKSLTAFPSLDHEADEAAWNAFGIAKCL
jgi:SAM-dependent methyltransferase